MFPISIRVHTLTTFLFILALAEVYGQDRKISAVLNPGCKTCSEEDTLVYIKATGSHDSIHQIWDFTRNIPTIIFAIGTVNSSLSINWSDDWPSKFLMSEQPQYSFSAVLDKLIEYDDIPDNGHFDPKLLQQSYNLRHMTWRRDNMTSLTEKEAKVVMSGYFRNKNGPKGRIELKMDLLPFKDYAVELPHLIHTANSSLVDVSLVNLTTHKGYNSSRFALHFVLASTDEVTDSMRFTMRKSLDDEHTPGVFEIVEIESPGCSSGSGGFVQFRPVGYTRPARAVATSTNAHVSDFDRTSLPQSSTVEKFYEGFDPSKLLVQDMVISFGTVGDGFYKQHNYTAWSFTIGYGAPPLEGFSLFVIVIIAVGLGVPVALALSGIAYVLVRKYKSRNAPVRFTDDE